jgi:hypothetical protein
MASKAESKPKNRSKMEAKIHTEQAIHGGQRNNEVFKVRRISVECINI